MRNKILYALAVKFCDLFSECVGNNPSLQDVLGNGLLIQQRVGELADDGDPHARALMAINKNYGNSLEFANAINSEIQTRSAAGNAKLARMEQHNREMLRKNEIN